MSLGWVNIRNAIIAIVVVQALWAFGWLAGLNLGLTGEIFGTGIKLSTIFGILDAVIAIAFWQKYI